MAPGKCRGRELDHSEVGWNALSGRRWQDGKQARRIAALSTSVRGRANGCVAGLPDGLSERVTLEKRAGGARWGEWRRAAVGGVGRRAPRWGRVGRRAAAAVSCGGSRWSGPTPRCSSGGPGGEDALHASVLEPRDVLVRDDAPTEHHDVLGPAAPERFDNRGEEGVVRSGRRSAAPRRRRHSARRRRRSCRGSGAGPCRPPRSPHRGSALATTLAPRSWPSRPGFATRIRTLRFCHERVDYRLPGQT